MARLFYPKIKTLYKRNEDFKVGREYCDPVFGNINKWLLTEKVDGTNMSVQVSRDTLDRRITKISVRGRTPNAQHGMFQQAIDGLALGSETLQYDHEEDSLHNSIRNLLNERDGVATMEIFGEAYGPGIQSGGWYADAQRFVVYDIRVNRSVWLQWDSVRQVCEDLDIRTVPVVSKSATIPFAWHLVKEGFASALTADERACEGVVARPATGELQTPMGDRIVWKLKHKDF